MNVVLDDAEEVWCKVSKKVDGSEATNGSSTGSSKSKKQYGDRTPLGGLRLLSLHIYQTGRGTDV